MLEDGEARNATSWLQVPDNATSYLAHQKVIFTKIKDIKENKEGRQTSEIAELIELNGWVIAENNYKEDMYSRFSCDVIIFPNRKLPVLLNFQLYQIKDLL